MHRQREFVFDQIKKKQKKSFQRRQTCPDLQPRERLAPLSRLVKEKRKLGSADLDLQLSNSLIKKDCQPNLT
jgi:hypothetical protein